MKNKIDELVHKLRDAMHEALATSCGVAEAMAELEQEGHCPTLLVDVSLAEESVAPPNEVGPFGEGLVLNDYDQQFLRAIKVASPV